MLLANDCETANRTGYFTSGGVVVAGGDYGRGAGGAVDTELFGYIDTYHLRVARTVATFINRAYAKFTVVWMTVDVNSARFAV